LALVVFGAYDSYPKEKLARCRRVGATARPLGRMDESTLIRSSTLRAALRAALPSNPINLAKGLLLVLAVKLNRAQLQHSSLAASMLAQ